MRWLVVVVLAILGCAFNENGSAVTDAGVLAIDAGPPDALAPDGGDVPITSHCSALHMVDPTLPSSVYPIEPDGTASSKVMTYCNMDDVGGGWTLLQRTVWDFNENMPLITNYATFYSSTIGSPQPFHGFRLSGRFWPLVHPAHEHLVVVYPHATDGSRCAAMYFMATQGTWTVPSAGIARIDGFIQSYSIFDGSSFSTTDSGPSQSCVNANQGVPWAYDNCCHTCPTTNLGFSPPRPAVTYISNSDILGHTVSQQCGALVPQTSGSFFAIDVMEYYVR